MRKQKRIVNIGGVKIGGDNPVAIQSMCNTDTRDVKATVNQIHELENAGCEIIRVAVPDIVAAKAVADIKKQIHIPLVVDIHFDYRLALECMKNGADKVRINPGNIGDRDRVKQVVEMAKEREIPIRIGVNGGSLERELLQKYGGVTADALVESAMGHVAILDELNFNNVVVSIKISDVPKMLCAYRKFNEISDIPLHIGVTESGTLKGGTVKSAVGIGALLAEGIGDTMRVSLTANPVEEIYAAYDIQKVLGMRKTGAEIVSCPTCGRTQLDLISIANEVEKRAANIDKPIKIAVMGCAVNGPGEAREADIGIAGGNKAKIASELWGKVKDNENGKLILVTAINPTPAGEGKTTTTIGLGDALTNMGKKCVLALREPSLGPVMGIKGGAAGGGYSQVVPMEDINLHFTGDMHAITAANNLLSAMIDNHIHQGNALDIDVTNIVWKRVVDMNDRALRHVVVGMGGKVNGIPREDGFMITVASEIMAILCLANDLEDLKKRLGEIIIGYNRSGEPVKASDLKAQGAMAALLKDAIKPNLVQTLEYTPCFIHGGPFANIAHGCNSVQATKLAMKLSDYTITEAGFGADLGAEKFMDIKCRMAGISPDAVVIVATVRALKYNGGVKKTDLKEENVDALKKGIVNLEKHIENMKSFGVPVVVAVNRFDTDSEEELNTVIERCYELGAECALSEVFAKGGEGGLDLAEKVISAVENQKADFKPAYDTDMSIKDKINEIVTKIYGGKGVNYTPKAQKQIARLEELGLDKKPVCMAKTQYSLSDNAKLLGRPENFEITVSNVRVSNGAGFIVVETGNIMVMPGLPKVPAADNIDVDADGKITGLF